MSSSNFNQYFMVTVFVFSYQHYWYDFTIYVNVQFIQIINAILIANFFLVKSVKKNYVTIISWTLVYSNKYQLNY
jgi:hypothetical protein